MRSAEWTVRASRRVARPRDRPFPFNSAFRIPHSALVDRRGNASLALDRLPGRRSYAAHRLQPPRPRSPHAARASLRTAAPRRRRAVARHGLAGGVRPAALQARQPAGGRVRSEEHTSELQSLAYLVCRLLLEKKKIYIAID